MEIIRHLSISVENDINDHYTEDQNNEVDVTEEASKITVVKMKNHHEITGKVSI